MIRSLNCDIAHCCCFLVIVLGAASNVIAKQEKESYRYYYVDADIVSLDAKQSLASYRPGGHVSGTSGSTIECSTPSTEISIAPVVESDRFYADITLTGLPKTKGDKKQAEGKKQRVDLTNLRPVSIDVDADKDGRTYHLNLVPTVKTVRLTPKSFQEIANDLYHLKFHASRITLNDKQYIGNMLASSADYFSIEICGVASIEFSLRHLKDAKPWGALTDGQITITNPDGTSIAISNVTNGKDDRLIIGGPYTVWVRWNKPQSTVEEYRAALKTWRNEMAKGTLASAAGDTKPDAIKRIDQELAREPGPWVIGCGAHELQKREIVQDE
jgi:hypothetical protein